MKILETERLLLRGLEQGDFKDVCKLLQDDEVMYAYEGAFNDQEVQKWPVSYTHLTLPTNREV